MKRVIPVVVMAILVSGAQFDTDVPGSSPGSLGIMECATVDDPDPPLYYRIDLVPTRNLPRIRTASGVGDMFYKMSPFGINVGKDGSYVYTLDVSFENLPEFPGKEFVVWLTTSDLQTIRRVGAIGSEGSVSGDVDWNKFLVVVTLEDASASDDATRWEGPIAYRGMSRSGLMHTMAGHGPFQQEPCATFGYQ